MAQVVADLEVVEAERLVLAVQVPLPQQPLVVAVRLEVAVVRGPLPAEPAVARLWLVHGLAASRSLGSR